MLLELSGTSNKIFINSSLKVPCNVNVTYLHGLKKKKKKILESGILVYSERSINDSNIVCITCLKLQLMGKMSINILFRRT